MDAVFKMKPTQATIVFICTFNVFIIALAIFLLSPALFFLLNLWQMIAITVGITGIFLAFNYFFSARNNWPLYVPADNTEKSRQDQESHHWTNSGVLTMAVLLISLFISYVLGLSMKRMFICAGSTEFIFVALLIHGKNREIKRQAAYERQKEQQQEFLY